MYFTFLVVVEEVTQTYVLVAVVEVTGVAVVAVVEITGIVVVVEGTRVVSSGSTSRSDRYSSSSNCNRTVHITLYFIINEIVTYA